MTTTILREIGPEDVPAAAPRYLWRCLTPACPDYDAAIAEKCVSENRTLMERLGIAHVAATRHRVEVVQITPDAP